MPRACTCIRVMVCVGGSQIFHVYVVAVTGYKDVRPKTNLNGINKNKNTSCVTAEVSVKQLKPRNRHS